MEFLANHTAYELIAESGKAGSHLAFTPPLFASLLILGRQAIQQF